MKRLALAIAAVVVVVLLVIWGRVPSKEEQAQDAYERGNSHYIKGEYDKAIAVLTEGINLDPTGDYSKYTYDKRGRSYGAIGEHDKAIADLTVAINIDPKFAAAYHNRGCAYEQKSEQAKAEADFAKAKELGDKPE